MNRTQWLEETKQKRFEEAYCCWCEQRLSQEEVMALIDLYTNHHLGWSASHFHNWYLKQGGFRSYRKDAGYNH